MPLYVYRISLLAQKVKNLPAMQETQVWSLSWEDSLEKSMATHSSILAWRVPGMKEPGGLSHFVYSFVYRWTFGLLPSAAMNMGVKISLWDSAFNSFGYISKVRLLDYLVVLNFWETSTLFSILVAPFYNTVNKHVLWFQFLHILTNISVCFFFYSSHANGYEVTFIPVCCWILSHSMSVTQFSYLPVEGHLSYF